MTCQKQIFTAIAGCLLMLVACRKTEHCTPYTGIAGEWTWKSSVGGIGGWTQTPQTDNLTRTLKIDDFTYREYVNDSLVFESGYDVYTRQDSSWGSNQYLKLEGGDELAFKVSATELELIEQCFDCFIHYYERR